MRRFAIVLLCVFASLPAHALTVVCPTQWQGHGFSYLTVFDGPVEKLASLEFEEDTPRQSHLDVGYIYDAGRSLHIQCNYKGGGSQVIELAPRVERCIATGERFDDVRLTCN